MDAARSTPAAAAPRRAGPAPGLRGLGWFNAPDVFISCARADGFGDALALGQLLGARGLPVQADWLIFDLMVGLGPCPCCGSASARLRLGHGRTKRPRHASA